MRIFLYKFFDTPNVLGTGLMRSFGGLAGGLDLFASSSCSNGCLFNLKGNHFQVFNSKASEILTVLCSDPHEFSLKNNAKQ